MTVNPWNSAPRPQKGDARKSTIYRSVGYALSCWEGYEFSLTLVFRCIVNADWNLPVERAFGSLLTYRARADMVSAAAEAYFQLHKHEALKADLKALMNRADQFAARRNEIAHGQVDQFYDSDGKRSGWALMPSYFSTNKRDLIGITERKQERLYVSMPRRIDRPKYAYSSKEIDGYAEEFSMLAHATGRIAGRFIDERMRAKIAILEPSFLPEFDAKLLKSRKKHLPKVRRRPPPRKP